MRGTIRDEDILIEMLGRDGSDMLASDLEPIGDPFVGDLQRQLADRDTTPEQVAQGIRRVRGDRPDEREARRASLNERVKKEAGGILWRLDIKHGGKTLVSPKRRLPRVHAGRSREPAPSA